MRPKFLAPLSSRDHQLLVELWQGHPNHRVRARAHCLLLSAQGFTIEQLAAIFQVDRDTISLWLRRWEEHPGDPEGLADEPRPGRPPKLAAGERQHAAERALHADPRAASGLLAAAAAVSRETARRWLAALGWVWKRCRRLVWPAPEPAAVAAARADLAGLEAQAATGALEVFYLDEAGFGLNPSVPYAWQRPGKAPLAAVGVPAALDPQAARLGLPATQGGGLQVLGLLESRQPL